MMNCRQVHSLLEREESTMSSRRAISCTIRCKSIKYNIEATVLLYACTNSVCPMHITLQSSNCSQLVDNRIEIVAFTNGTQREKSAPEHHSLLIITTGIDLYFSSSLLVLAVDNSNSVSSHLRLLPGNSHSSVSTNLLRRNISHDNIL